MQLKNIIAERPNKTVYRDGDKRIKVFDSSFSKADVLNEALNQARVENIGLNTPKILGVDVIDGKWAIISEFIEGETLADLMKKYPDKKDECLEFLVDLQIEIFSKNVPLLNKLKDKMARQISETTLDNNTLYDLQTQLKGMPTHNKICHGDFNPSNIIITKDKKAYILDWSHVTQGNASADVARTYLLFSLDGDKEAADKYLNIFCKKTGTDIRYVQKWMPLVAAAQSTKGKTKEEKEFLLSWVNVFDYE